MGSQFPPGLPPMGAGSFGRMHEPMFPPGPVNYRPGGGMPGPPPGLGGPMAGRPFPIHFPPGYPHPPGEPFPGMHQAYPPPESMVPVQPSSHSRHGSASFEAANADNKGSGSTTQPIPISKPAPIGRPSSIVHGYRGADFAADIDDVSNHLGSSALLDDSDEPLGNASAFHRGTAAPGARSAFPAAPFMDPVFGSPLNSGWGAPQNAFSPPPGFGNGWPPQPAFGGPPPGIRGAQPRSVVVRQMLVQACKDLQPPAADANGYIDLAAIKGHVDSITPQSSEPVPESDLLDMCETEGNAQNGGGSFDVRRDTTTGKVTIRFDMDSSGPGPAPFGAPGEIGSPVVGGGAGPFGSRF
jgi:hypothetical protein